MKYFCLDRDSCGHTRTLTEAEYKTAQFSKPFHNCELCNYYMVLVNDDFDLENLNTIKKALTVINTIIEEK